MKVLNSKRALVYKVRCNPGVRVEVASEGSVVVPLEVVQVLLV